MTSALFKARRSPYIANVHIMYVLWCCSVCVLYSKIVNAHLLYVRGYSLFICVVWLLNCKRMPAHLVWNASFMEIFMHSAFQLIERKYFSEQ